MTHSDDMGAHLRVSTFLFNRLIVTRENSQRRQVCVLGCLRTVCCADTILCFDRRGCPLIKDGHGDGQNHPVKLHLGWESEVTRDPGGYVKARKRKARVTFVSELRNFPMCVRCKLRLSEWRENTVTGQVYMRVRILGFRAISASALLRNSANFFFLSFIAFKHRDLLPTCQNFNLFRRKSVNVTTVYHYFIHSLISILQSNLISNILMLKLYFLS